MTTDHIVTKAQIKQPTFWANFLFLINCLKWTQQQHHHQNEWLICQFTWQVFWPRWINPRQKDIWTRYSEIADSDLWRCLTKMRE